MLLPRHSMRSSQLHALEALSMVSSHSECRVAVILRTSSQLSSPPIVLRRFLPRMDVKTHFVWEEAVENVQAALQTGKNTSFYGFLPCLPTCVPARSLAPASQSLAVEQHVVVGGHGPVLAVDDALHRVDGGAQGLHHRQHRVRVAVGAFLLVGVGQRFLVHLR